MQALKVMQLCGWCNPDDTRVFASADTFLNELSQAMGMPVVAAESEEAFAAQGLPVYFIVSGGSAYAFSQTYHLTKGPYILLTTPSYNSLAASMEMMGFLQTIGETGRILHGSMEELAKELKQTLQIYQARNQLQGMRLGVIGETKALVGSRADNAKLHAATGAELVMIPMEEFFQEYHVGGYEDNAWTETLKASGYDAAEMEKALNVYGAVCRLKEKYQVQAVTVRCFDMLDTIGTTGCLALAILNALGVPAACEGDTRTLIAMAVLDALTHEPIFMANPVMLDKARNEMCFAHCTLPMNMPNAGYALMTHFESGLGVAIDGSFTPGPVTIFKCSEDLSRFYVQEGELLESLHKADQCRTQMRIHLPEGTDYFLSSPIANHHLIVKGHHADVIRAFFEA